MRPGEGGRRGYGGEGRTVPPGRAGGENNNFPPLDF
jgi:hypothetical protein